LVAQMICSQFTLERKRGQRAALLLLVLHSGSRWALVPDLKAGREADEVGPAVSRPARLRRRAARPETSSRVWRR
jgi:hypothetical protein